MLDLSHIALLLPAFAVVLMRISGIMFSAPLFSLSAIPVRVKVGLALVITLIVFPIVQPDMAAAPTTFLGTAFAATGELLVGLTIGLAVNLLFTGLQLAAQTISQQMGFGLARVLNPTMDEETDILEQFYLLVGTVLLLALNGHHLILSGVLDSFKAMPPMTVTMQPEMLETLRGLLSGCYVMALKIAAPVLVVFMLVSVVMGFIGKTVPQINILVVGFPLRVTIGLAALIPTFGATLVVFSDSYRDTVDAVGEMIRRMGA
jgi:flagellar biosynthetic protein FliR